jgi:hypothetical protein
MKLSFLSGILCGVIMAVVVTFTVTIPANNDHWRVEITNRGGGAWSIDKEGNFHWSWTVQPISYHRHSAPLIIVPRSQPSSDSSRERL